MTEDLKSSAQEFLVRYGGDQFPELFTSAKGSIVVDVKGREILDFTSGQMCATIGHNHPAILTALEEAGEKAVHMFSGMIPEVVVKLAEKLSSWLPSPLKKSLFVSTGGESNEAALRMAKMFTGGYEVIALGGSWHGTGAGASAVSYASDRRGYGPSMPGTYVIPEPNAYRCPIEHCRDVCDQTCLKVGMNMFDMASRGEGAAIIAEPILSAGGVIVPPQDYFKTLKAEAHRREMVLVYDEAQTAFGRIGVPFGAEYFDSVPDIMTVSKTLGGGVPLAAVITTDTIEANVHEKGFTFYTSHVADPLPAAVGLAVLATIEIENLVLKASEKGAYLRARLEDLQQKYEAIGDVRGAGLLLGVELVKDRESREPDHELGAVTTRRCFELGLSMNIRRRPERGAVWRIAPPLTVKESEIDQGVDVLDRALGESQIKLKKNMVRGMSIL
ncbi:MAG: aspartate aminotransferase family protein [Rhodospirillaceae bacterium TMED8]|nr:aspartate aminotransferase family protein [Magnetovibrio sp.]OUT53213.1 MAG: aspartate aminotransferase family protein [Rhodospirillaceae bacterium TMED8]